MILTVLFILGVANFAVHKAVLESGHPFLASVPAALRANGGRISLTAEFIILLSAMLLANGGWSSAGWAYAFYSACNGVAGWTMLRRAE
ncbi:hypothetical protein [Qipengyuania marisflavi]|uniref:DUF3784 domain-containing protein n=1 Tax=Qipengyuania marisflavi TaxID=2486356 RepID=A0A5S3P5D1_9SPHN|nr:hypothetical protein [Qipengyuania marisflavi]TMM48227.1 hypothetical protein FEV51_08015 [Qipengyuania marisflavi]